jgi:hypothetical protein
MNPKYPIGEAIMYAAMVALIIAVILGQATPA